MPLRSGQLGMRNTAAIYVVKRELDSSCRTEGGTSQRATLKFAVTLCLPYAGNVHYIRFLSWSETKECVGAYNGQTGSLRVPVVEMRAADTGQGHDVYFDLIELLEDARLGLSTLLVFGTPRAISAGKGAVWRDLTPQTRISTPVCPRWNIFIPPPSISTLKHSREAKLLN